MLLDHATATVTTTHGIPSPGEAWRRVMDVARSWHEGMRTRDRFTPPVLDALDRIGGIRAVALAEQGVELGRLERHFREAYAPQHRAATDRALAQPLPAPATARPTMLGATVKTDTVRDDRARLAEGSTV